MICTQMMTIAIKSCCKAPESHIVHHANLRYRLCRVLFLGLLQSSPKLLR